MEKGKKLYRSRLRYVNLALTARIFSSSPVRLLRVDYPWSHASFSDGIFQLFIFLSTLLHTLIITDDVEIHDMGKPIPLHQLRRCIQVLKKLLHRACCLDLPKEEDTPSQYLGLSLISASAKVMRDLYDRSSRKPLCLPKLWIIDDLLECEIRRCDSFDDYERLLSLPVLRICPFLVSFKRRLKLFERIVTTNRILIQGQNNPNPFVMDSGLKPGIPVRIMRGRVLEVSADVTDFHADSLKILTQSICQINITTKMIATGRPFDYE